jgi:hypothetical protein
MMNRNSYTAVIERNVIWSGLFTSEPYEGAWAGEAIFFVRALAVSGDMDAVEARIQISPDGLYWCDEGTTFNLPTAVDAVSFGRVSHFGGWLRVVGDVPQGAQITVIVYLVLKA